MEIQMHLFYFFIACGEEVSPKSEPSQEGTIIQDMDGDGFNAEEDCNDNDATINSSYSRCTWQISKKKKKKVHRK